MPEKKYIDVSIIIVNYNSPHLIKRCLKSIDKYVTNVRKEVIVVDNNSKEECLSELEQRYSFVRVVRLQQNIGFGKANNVGVAKARSDLILLLNSDIELVDYSINDAFTKFKEEKQQVMWGFKHLWPNRKFQNSFSKEIRYVDLFLSYIQLFSHLRIFNSIIRDHKYSNKPFDEITEIPVIYGTSMLMRAQDFHSIGGFDKDYFMYFEDIDLCDKFRKNYGKIFFYPHTEIIHHVMGGKNENRKSINLYKESRYLYGVKKFGKLRMLVFSFVDIVSEFMGIIYRAVKKKKLLFNKRLSYFF